MKIKVVCSYPVEVLGAVRQPGDVFDTPDEVALGDGGLLRLGDKFQLAEE